MDVARLERQGILFIVSAPSGAGKTTICRRALARVEGLRVSVSCTTRPRRAGEADGEDYVFLSVADFEGMRDRGGFAEWALVHGFLYGTPRQPIEDALAAGGDMLLDIDVQGSRQMKSRYREAVSVFVLPPSVAELENRLRKRATDSEDTIRRRLERAKAEMEEYRSYDYYLVNHDIDASVGTFAAIVAAERQRVSRLR